jgi:hypothetical protein
LQDSNSKNKNKIKNNHFNLPNSKNAPEYIDNSDMNGKCSPNAQHYLIGMSGKYNSGMLNEETLQKAPVSGPVNQFFCGEMSLNGDLARRIAADDQTNINHIMVSLK